VAAVAVRFVLDQPGVAAVITGASTARQVVSTLWAFEVELTEEDHARMREATGADSHPRETSTIWRAIGPGPTGGS
jgi:aryl-alcohol dehydrogenase-like predicted oxidoreductase